MGDDYVDEKIEQYERKLKQAKKAGKHHKAKKYAEKLERLRAEAAEQDTDSDTDSDDDDIDSDDDCATSNCARPFSATDRTPATTAGASSYNLERSRRVRGVCRKVLRSRACTRV